MFTTFTVQPLLRGVHLDDASTAESSSRPFLDRPPAQGGATSPSTKSTGIFGRNTRPILESLDSFESHLYLGTSDGFVLHYTIDEQISSESDLPRSRLIRRLPLGFGKKVVERIMVLPLLRIAIVLCDSTLSFFSLPDFQPFATQVLPPIKGVTAFCEEGSLRGSLADDGSVRLCVTKRRTIQFYSLWPDAISEPKSSQSGSRPQVYKPVCIAIGENEFLLASATSSGQTAIGIFCSGTGDPVRGTLQWSSYPRALAVEFPYVTALLRGNVVEVHNILDQQLVQTIRYDASVEVRTLMQGPGLKVWMSALSRVLTLQSGEPNVQGQGDRARRQVEANRISTVLARVLVAGKDSVSALVTTPLVLHADMLLQRGRVEEALLLSEKTTATMSAENLHRERLQFELDYIHQKSGLIYLAETLFDDAFGLFQRGKIDPRVLISMFPDVLQQHNLMGEVILYRGIHEQITQLGTLPDIIGRALSKSGGEQGGDFGRVLLMNAKEIFHHYLVRFHKEHSVRKGRSEPQLQATDTALLGLWVDSGDDANLIQLLESNNACIQNLSEQKLKDSNKYYALSLWYKAKKNYSATLSIWKRLHLGEVQDSSYNATLQDMATLLLSIQDVSLIEDYGWWIVEQNETIGLKIFMPGDAKRAAMFDPDRVLARLESKISQDGIMSYLEYVVLHRKSESTDHHRILSQMYVGSIARLAADPSNKAKHDDLVTEFVRQQEHFRTRLCQLLQSTVLYNSAELLTKVEAIPEMKLEKAILLARLEKYKECLKIMVEDIRDYQGAEILCLNAGVFKNPRRGSKATLQDGSQTKESTSDNSKKRSLFMLLLQEYLHMAQDQGGMALTLCLLDSQSAYLDISEVIELLPPFWSVELLQRYLLRSLRRNYHEFKEIQIIKGLSLGENLRISEELFQLYESQGPAVITPDDVCDVCGTALADDVFMRTLDKRVIHLHCGSTPNAMPSEPAE
ncbi:transforming growth factor, beta receptor associated protein 1 [Dissophora globulifera]|nr:transforming growth factor, beta receptor associated protein 1 [Dissophora globulifera]